MARCEGLRKLWTSPSRTAAMTPASSRKRSRSRSLQLGLGHPRRLFQHQAFFEGELRLIARALRQMKDKHPTRP